VRAVVKINNDPSLIWKESKKHNVRSLRTNSVNKIFTIAESEFEVEVEHNSSLKDLLLNNHNFKDI